MSKFKIKEIKEFFWGSNTNPEVKEELIKNGYFLNEREASELGDCLIIMIKKYKFNQQADGIVFLKEFKKAFQSIKKKNPLF